jgi:hypothetical protein
LDNVPALRDRAQVPPLGNNPKESLLGKRSHAIGPNGSDILAPLTFAVSFRNLPKLNGQLPVTTSFTGINVSCPVRTRSAIYA